MNKSLARHRGFAVSAPFVAFAVSAAFAATTATVTSLAPHRTWGVLAACVYAAAALAAATGRGGQLVRGGAFAGAACVPLLVLVAKGSAQEEVHVVHRAAARLLTEGTPYLRVEQLEGADYSAYNPYLPGMALFGIPRQLAGVDARFVFAAVFLAAFASSVRLAQGTYRGRRATVLLAASPLVALPMATGGDDLPVIGLVCLGLTLAGSGRPGRAGLVLGLAGILKATAWPALAVALALLAARSAHHAGRNAAPGTGRHTAPRAAVLRCAASAASTLAAGLALPALVDPGGLVANTVSYPLGVAGVESPAAAPLPGKLLADLGPLGHSLAVGALLVAALAVGVSLLVRPPRDVRAAASRLALGLLVAMALMPASRFGYLVYPTVLVLWAHWRTSDAQPAQPAQPAPYAESVGRSHADRHQRLPAEAGRHREVRARDRVPVPSR